MKFIARLIPILVGATVLLRHQPAEAAPGRIITGTDTNAAGPHVKAFSTRTQTQVASFFAYTPSFTGGVRVAAGDVNGDGAADIITGAGPGAGPHVKVFSGTTLGELHSFFAFDVAFTGGVYVAAGDLDGDGFADVITGTGAGAGPHVKVFSGTNGAMVRSFFAYAAGFQGGVRVATGDVNGDGLADIITGTGPGGGPHVKVFSGTSLAELDSFFAYDVSFAGGVYVAAGDVNGDGRSDIITGVGGEAGPHVKVFNGVNGELLHSFFAYTPSFTGGVRVAAGDVNGDGRAEIITAPGPGTTPQVRILDGVTLAERASFLAYASTFTDGVFVSAASLTRPRLRIGYDSSKANALLDWPAGESCVLEANAQASDPRGWREADAQPTKVGNRIQVALPIGEKPAFFRLNCDDEAVP